MPVMGMAKDATALTLATEDVGSLPLHDDFQLSREHVKRAILDKVSVGLDYPCYPQLPGTEEHPMNMNLQFLIPLAEGGFGLRVEKGSVYQVGELKKPDRPIGVERAIFYLNFLKENHLLDKIRGPKACVTGPFTLAGYIDRQNILTCGTSKSEVVSTLARIVADTCMEFDRIGFSIINVDEPFFAIMLGRRSLFGYNENFVVEVLNSILGKIHCFSAVHVCGAVTPLIKKVLLESEADIIDHEFQGTPQNLKIYTRREIEDRNKILAFGCVSSSNPNVESVDQIKCSIKKGLDIFGDKIIIKPDCGFGGLIGLHSAYEISIQKLKNMVQAVKELRGSLNTSS